MELVVGADKAFCTTEKHSQTLVAQRGLVSGIRSVVRLQVLTPSADDISPPVALYAQSFFEQTLDPA
jgi:hypothetical protein